MIYCRKYLGVKKMPMYKRVMAALGIMLLVVAAASFYEYGQGRQEMDLTAISASQNEASQHDEGKAAVYVTGEVAKPGVVYVAQDGRVGEAINQCGGLLPTADVGQINMAATVKDGMEVRVRAKSLPRGDSAGEGANKTSSEGTASGKKAASTAAQASSGGDMVNINTADAEGLRKLKGIGPAMAQRIIDYREANGAFQSPEDLQQVKGIGKAKFAKLKEQIAI